MQMHRQTLRHYSRSILSHILVYSMQTPEAAVYQQQQEIPVHGQEMSQRFIDDWQEWACWIVSAGCYALVPLWCICGCHAYMTSLVCLLAHFSELFYFVFISLFAMSMVGPNSRLDAGQTL